MYMHVHVQCICTDFIVLYIHSIVHLCNCFSNEEHIVMYMYL